MSCVTVTVTTHLDSDTVTVHGHGIRLEYRELGRLNRTRPRRRPCRVAQLSRRSTVVVLSESAGRSAPCLCLPSRRRRQTSGFLNAQARLCRGPGYAPAGVAAVAPRRRPRRKQRYPSLQTRRRRYSKRNNQDVMYFQEQRSCIFKSNDQE